MFTGSHSCLLPLCVSKCLCYVEFTTSQSISAHAAALDCIRRTLLLWGPFSCGWPENSGFTCLVFLPVQFDRISKRKKWSSVSVSLQVSSVLLYLLHRQLKRPRCQSWRFSRLKRSGFFLLIKPAKLFINSFQSRKMFPSRCKQENTIYSICIPTLCCQCVRGHCANSRGWKLVYAKYDALEKKKQ